MRKLMIHPKHWHFLPVPSLSLQTLQTQMQFEPNRFHKARTSLRIDQFKRKNYLSVSYIFFFFLPFPFHATDIETSWSDFAVGWHMAHNESMAPKSNPKPLDNQIYLTRNRTESRSINDIPSSAWTWTLNRPRGLWSSVKKRSETAPATICRPYRKVALELWP